jgi:hypothetical protein
MQGLFQRETGELSRAQLNRTTIATQRSRPLVTPTISTSVQDNTELSTPLNVGHFSARTSINRLCPSCTPSGLPTRKHSLLGARTAVSYTDMFYLDVIKI